MRRGPRLLWPTIQRRSAVGEQCTLVNRSQWESRATPPHPESRSRRAMHVYPVSVGVPEPASKK
eukprot:12815063-Alexandrium_andersonii.AAC.1